MTQAAINYAIDNGISVINLEAGKYDFCKDPIGGQTENAYLYINQAENLTLKGKVDSDGNPATEFIRLNSGENSADLRQLMMIINSDNITVENIRISTQPYYYSAGNISLDGNRIRVKVLSGYPCNDNMAIYLPGLYDLQSKRIVEQRLYYNDINSSSTLYFTKTDDGELTVESELLAQKIAKKQSEYENDDLLLYWFQGNSTPSFQMIKNFDVRGVTYRNVDITSSTGFGLTCDFCKDVTFSDVKLSPDERGILSAPRDGFHINNCSGKIIMDGIVLDGMSDDGQNIHSCFYSVKEQIDSQTIAINNYKFSAKFIPAGSNLSLYTPNTNKEYFSSEIESVQKSGDLTIVKLKDKLPDDIVFQPTSSGEPSQNNGVSLVSFSSLCPDKYILKNSIIRNTYRGLKLSCKNAEIYNNLFESNQCNILIAAENDAWFTEGVHPENIKIYNNTFKSPLCGTSIDIHYEAFPEIEPSDIMSDIHVFDNSFYNCDIAVAASHCSETYVYDNKFYDVAEQIKISPSAKVITEPPTEAKDIDFTASEAGAAEENLYMGDRTRLFAVIRNNGRDIYSGEVTVNFSIAGTTIDSVTVDVSIAPGKSAVITSNKEWVADMGSWAVRADINYKHTVAETNYNNNSIKGRIAVAD